MIKIVSIGRQYFRQMRGSVSGLLLLALLIHFSACKNNGEVLPVVETDSVDVVNAAADTLNFYQNGTRLNKISGLSPGSSSGYLYVPIPLPVDSILYEFKIAGRSDYLFSNYKLKLGYTVAHSLFAAGETASKVFLVNDLLPASSSTLATIRFVNASPGTTNLTVVIGAVSFSNQAFKSASGFTTTAAGINTVTVYQYGTTTVLYTGTVTLLAGDIYTLFARGVAGGTGQNKLSASLVVNY